MAQLLILLIVVFQILFFNFYTSLFKWFILNPYYIFSIPTGIFPFL